jgi:hypothetical protein
VGEGEARLTDGVEFDQGSLKTRGTPMMKFVDLILFRVEGRKGERRGRPRLFIVGLKLAGGVRVAWIRSMAGEDPVQERETSGRRGMTCGAGMSAGERGSNGRGPGVSGEKNTGSGLGVSGSWAPSVAGPNRSPAASFLFSFFLSLFFFF